MTKKHYIAAAVICAIGLLVWAGSDEYFARDWAAFQETPDWNEWEKRLPPGEDAFDLRSNDSKIPLEKRPSILLQTDPSTHRLFLKHRYGTGLFVYDPDSRNISKIDESGWTKAETAISNCWSQLSTEHDLNTTFNTYPDYQARLHGKKIDAYGRFTLDASESPSNSKVAVLSASGWRSGPGIGFIGLGGSDPKIHGQLYVQVVDIKSGKFIGDPVRIKIRDDLDRYRLCWSVDERFVVAYKPYEDFSVVRVTSPTD